MYDFDTRIELGRYVGEHDDLIDFYENEENNSECESVDSESAKSSEYESD